MHQNFGGQVLAYAAIFSYIIQPTGQPTNFALSVTDFSVTVVQICKHLTKKGLKNNPVYNLGAYNFPQNTPFF